MSWPMLLVVGVVLFAVSSSEGASRPIWPRKFDVAFGASVLPGVANNPALVNISSYFWYDWTIKSQRIDYPDSCIPVLPGNFWRGGCSLIFNTKGCYILAPQLGVPCCFFLPGIGTIPPDFLAPFNASQFIIPMPDYYGVLHNTNFWTTNEGFYYWTDSTSGQDIWFVDGGMLNWAFVPEFSHNTQAANLYDIPANCAASCPSMPETAIIGQRSYYSPLIGLSKLHYPQH